MELELELEPRHDAGAVCCMCGDRGLPHELLRCKLCRVRLQHRYCSDLYPTATAYRRCNWCLRLREQTEGGGAQGLPRAVAGRTTDKRKAPASADASTSEEEEEEEQEGVCRQSHEAAGCATTRSRRSAAEVGRPVKKQKAGDRAALPPSPGAAAKGNNGNKKQKADDRAALPPSPGATAKGNNGCNKQKGDERVALTPSPGATAKGYNGSTKQKGDERVALPATPGATAKGGNGSNKKKADDRATLPPSPGATAKGDKYNGNKKPMQAGKLTRPGRVKVRRYRLLAEVISC